MQVFSSKICQISKNTLFYGTTPVAAKEVGNKNRGECQQ